MMNSDLHHIVKSLHSASQSTKIEVIPTNDEKFIAHNFGVFIETRKRKRDEVAVYEYLRLIDSFKFMPCSLDKLVQSLHDKKFSLLDHFYRGYRDEQRKLLKKKGIFKRNLKTVEKKEFLKGICLKDNQIDVTNEELIQLNNVFKVFNFESLKQFLEL